MQTCGAKIHLEIDSELTSQECPCDLVSVRIVILPWGCKVDTSGSQAVMRQALLNEGYGRTFVFHHLGHGTPQCAHPGSA